jgi:hypothetical protein
MKVQLWQWIAGATPNYLVLSLIGKGVMRTISVLLLVICLPNCDRSVDLGHSCLTRRLPGRGVGNERLGHRNRRRRRGWRFGG